MVFDLAHRVSRRILVVLPLTALLLAPGALADSYWLGLASFRGESNAQSYAQAHRHKVEAPLAVTSVDTSRGPYFRVIAGPYDDIALARQAVAAARQEGFATAWLVVGSVERDGITLAAPAPAPAPAPVTKRVTVKEQLRSATDFQSRTSAGPVAEALSPPQAPASPVASEPKASSPVAPERIDLAFTPGEAIVLTKIDTSVTPITVDGFVNEAVWQNIPVIDDFVVLEPDTLAPGEHVSLLRVAYSDKGMYISAEFEQPLDTLVKRFSGRDVRDNRDSVSVTIDTSGEGRYGFWFGVNLGDALMDGTVLPERKFTSDWDGPWYGRSQQTDKGWSAEMFIPWGIVSMPASGEARTMGMYVSRKVAYKDERWGWPALPPTGSKFMSALQSMEMSDIQPRQQYNVYPYVSTAYDGIDARQLYRAGADIFWRPSTNFQLNATLNPDFGNVESDEVVINLTATETFFPEKRLFFLEGQDIFVASPRADTRGRGVGNSGAPYTMVNTRRIGGQPREPAVGPGVEIPDRELLQPSELIGAFKATGQLGPLRYGVLGASEEDVKFDVIDNGQPRNLKQDGNDYGITRLLYEDSYNGAYRALGVLSTAVLNPERDAIAHGVDWHYLSSGGRFLMDGQYMMSDIDGIDEKGYGGFLDFELTYRQGLKQRIGLEYFDENIDINDLGFLQRNNEYRVRSSLQWTRSDFAWARENQFDMRGFYQRSVTESLVTGGGIFFSDRVSLNDLSQLVLRANYFIRSYDDLNSFGNGTYRIDDRVEGNVGWESDSTQVWSYGFDAGYSEENLGGDSLGAGFSLNWRPTSRFGVELKVDYDDRDGWLLHQGDDLFATFKAQQWLPKLSVEYYISARQQLRLSFQYVGIKAREDEFFRIPTNPDDLIPIDKPTGPGTRSRYDFSVSQYSLQARYRWEIAPLSDVFLVYTRQADLRAALDEETFNDLFNNAWEAPLSDILVFKIRYRFGS